MRSSSASQSDLRQRLVWVTVFRTVATTLLLVALAARLLSAPSEEGLSAEDSFFFLLIGLVYLSTIGYGLWLRRREVGLPAVWVQIAGDIVLATALVYLTGGAESPFTFVYLLAVVCASVVLDQRGALLAAAGSSAAFVLLTATIHLGGLRAPAGATSLSLGHLAFLVISNLLAQFLIAVLVSHLARQLTRAGGELVAREADLLKLAALQRRILDCMPSGLVTGEPDGRVSFVNRAGAAILGASEREAVGRGLEELIPGVRSIALNARRSELSVPTPRGPRVLGLSLAPLDERAGALLVVFQDLTELRRAEQELARADRLASLGQFSAQLAHEIRNPLASMRGSAQLLAAEAPTDGPLGRLSGILMRESDRLSSLLDDFLRFARPPAPTLARVPLDELIRNTVEMLLTDPLAHSVRIISELYTVWCEADADQLQQVLLNLIRNALQAVGRDGEVRVWLSEGEAGPRIHVWDSAGSIAPEDLPRLFEPFFTKRPGGTGLGLATAHSIVRAHGGSIGVKSSKAAGTEFVVGLPGKRGGHADSDRR